MASSELLSVIRKHTLYNAYRHGGKAEIGAVAGKIAAEVPWIRAQLRSIMPQVRTIVEEVNLMTQEEQLNELKRLHPSFLQAAEEPKEEERHLPPLPDARHGEVVLRLPPEPSGYMHIGHAVAGLINHLYAQMYEGTLWLRFEDTNPRNAETEYYENFRDGYRWLGVKWHHEKNVSDDLETIYRFSLKLLEQGYMYACFCSPEATKKNRLHSIACGCTTRTPDESLGIWEKMLSGEKSEGEASIRFKGDMTSLDASLRDPTLLRVVEHPHPIYGSKYRVWPNYDLAVVIEDYLCGVTHILRSMEFHVNLQNVLRGLLGFPEVKIIQFARVNFEGTPLSKRLLRPLVQQGLVQGWDDPRMPTISGIRRRGVLPETLLRFTMEVGYTKVKHVFGWDLVYAINRKILDPSTRRYFFVPEPVLAEVSNAPRAAARIRLHPDKDLGERKIETGSVFYLPREDVIKTGVGGIIRLIDLYNVKVTAKNDNKVSLSYAGNSLVKDMPKVQWVTDRNTPFAVLVPGALFAGEQFNEKSLLHIKGVAEKDAETLKEGDFVQFPRFGFCRIDRPLQGIFAHK